MRKHKGGMVALVVTAGVTLGACGGNDSPQLSKAEYIERGSAICAAASQKIESAAQAKFSEPGIQPAMSAVSDFAVDTVAPTIENEVEKLSELRPPEVDKDRIEDILQAGRDGVENIRRDSTIIINTNDDGLGRYQELSSAYGLDGCGGGSDATRDALAGIDRNN